MHLLVNTWESERKTVSRSVDACGFSLVESHTQSFVMKNMMNERDTTLSSSEVDLTISDDESEVCCVCLDSLSSSPVTLLLSKDDARRSCRHFIHASCAQKIYPQKCPLCRVPYNNTCSPIDRRMLCRLDGHAVVRACRKIDGDSVASDVARTSTVVGLLAATCPIRERTIARAAKTMETLCNEGALDARRVVQLFRACGIVLSSNMVATKPSRGTRLEGYTISTRLRRFLRSCALRMAGAIGTAICSSFCGAMVGMSLGALVSIPSEYAIDFKYLDSGLSAAYGILLVIQMVYYGLRNRHLLVAGLLWGSASGSIIGWLGALLVVHPESHGAWQVFRSGLTGQTILRMLSRHHRIRDITSRCRSAPVDLFEIGDVSDKSPS